MRRDDFQRKHTGLTEHQIEMKWRSYLYEQQLMMEAASIATAAAAAGAGGAGGGAVVREYTSAVVEIDFANTGNDEWTFTFKAEPDELYSTQGAPYGYGYRIFFASNGQETLIAESTDDCTTDTQIVVSGNGPGTYKVLQQYYFDENSENDYGSFSNLLLTVDGNTDYTKLFKLNGIRITEISHWTFKAEFINVRENCEYYPIYVNVKSTKDDSDPVIKFATTESEIHKDTVLATLYADFNVFLAVLDNVDTDNIDQFEVDGVGDIMVGFTLIL